MKNLQEEFMKLSIDEGIAIVKKQEELIQFSHFNRKDVWDLGTFFVEEIFAKNYTLAFSIRMFSGLIAFQYFTEGTNLNNNHWMTRKFNLVQNKEASSLLTKLVWEKNNEPLEAQGMESTEYVTCGGGFPITIRGTGPVAVALVSGLPHLQDHDILVDGLSRFLGIADVPRIPLDAGL
ncbi:conserved hypothetical protein [Treponema primitia ZAS-2]|uniref:Uncharacterized protein n=2 Tax=Treponema primitia TaxID=88058 RepID=F5YJI8_TREPZ|nr:conserved hypothetical protein [Treponema primitia ZAS-2]